MNMSSNTAKSEDVQKIILALLVSQKDAVSLAHLDRDYKEQEGECIPWKELGYISLFDYLKSIPKYVYLERINGMYHVRGIASDKSKHVSSLVARQKNFPKKPPYARRTYKPSCYYPKTQRPRIQLNSDILTDIIYIVRENPSGINKEYILKKVREKLPYVNISIMDLEEQFKDLEHELFVQGNLVLPAKSKNRFIPEKSSESSEISIQREESPHSQNVNTTTKFCVSGDSDCELNIDDDNDFSFVSNDDISNNYNKNDQNTMTKKKQSISMFIQETVSKHNIQGDKLNETFKYNTTENEYYGQNNVTLDTLAEKESKGDLNYYIDDENAKLLINEQMRCRLKKLIQKYPNGIWCAELPEKFFLEYNRSLHYVKLGFNSVREFASYLPDIFQCKQFQPSGDFILYDAKNKLTDAEKKDGAKSGNITEFSQYYQEEDEIQAIPAIVSSDTSNKLMPDGVMVIGETVGQISVIDLESRLQPYVEVFVEEVFTPSLFWVQLRKKKKLFNKLMEDLHTFYEEKSALYKIPLLVIEKGLNCACVYNDQWHRGIIKQVRPDLQVTVMFYDYGTLKTYPPEAIFYLHRSFSYLPAQAIPCGLYNTKPRIGKQWSRGVTHEFAVRTAQKPLIATVVSTDLESNSMLVTLTDTMEEEDVHINDWLVQQNLALHGKMVRIRPRNFPFRYYLQCKRYQKSIKTNSIDCISSKSGIIKYDEDKKSISLHLTKKSALNDSCRSSKHVLSPSVNSNTCDYLSLKDLKKDTQISQKPKTDSIRSNNLSERERLTSIFRKLIDSKGNLSSSSCEAKPDDAQLHSDTNMRYMEKNEPKVELEKVDNSNSTSSSMKCNDPIPTISQNDYFVKAQLQKQDNYSTNRNRKDYVESQDVSICTEQNEQKQENIPLPKKCFINAVNLSVDSKSYSNYDTLPDDNITIINDTSKLITKCKNKINLKSIEIGVSDKILSALRSSRNFANDECHTDTLENATNSSNQVQIITTEVQRNDSKDNEIMTPNAQKHFDITNINENENYKFNDGSTKSCMSKEKSILSDIAEYDKLKSNNTTDSNSNSISNYNECFVNEKNTTRKSEIFKTLLKMYNIDNDNFKLDSDDSSNLDNNMHTYEIDTKVSNSISNISTDSIDEDKSNFVDNTDINEYNLVTATCDSQLSLENEDNDTKEQMKLDETIYMDPDEEVIPSYNDNDIGSDKDEWDVVGDMHDFFKNCFLSNIGTSNEIKHNDEGNVKITEINDD